LPIYLDIHNIILNKSAKSWNEELKQRLQKRFGKTSEDNELFVIHFMNHFSEEEFCEDFKIRMEDFGNVAGINRYGSIPEFLGWLKGNSTFVWHLDCKPESIKRAKLISEEMDVGEILFRQKKGEELLKSFK
jgi:hypothetical protein